MKILQILPELNAGGVETGTVDLARYLVRNGHRAIVISAGGSLVKDLGTARVRHYSLSVHRKSLFTILTMIPKVSHIIRRESIDIVHARSRVPAIIGFFAARRTGIKFITTCHGYYRKHLFSGVMGWGNLVIVISNVVGRHMIDSFGVPVDRLKLIYRGVDLARFKPSPKKDRDTTTIGIVGRLSPLKGHEYFLKAISKVTRRGKRPNLRVLIIGDASKRRSDYKRRLELLVRQLGLTNYVDFLGRRKDIPELLSQMDLLVLSTVTEEAFGRVIIEAGACGVPVVATEVGGVSEVIRDGENGILVPPRDINAMAAAITRVLEDKRLSNRLTEKARVIVEKRFSLEELANKTVKVYKEALQKERILIIKIGAPGDVILSVPAIRAIRKRFSKAKISVLIGLNSRHILKACPYIDELITYDKKRHGIPAGLWRLSGQLRRSSFDKVIDLQNNKRSHLLGYLSCAAHRYGYQNGKWSILLNYRADLPRLPMDPVNHQFRILGLLGIEEEAQDLELWPSVSDRRHIATLLSDEWVDAGQSLIGINPGGSARWKTKRWPLEYFAELIDGIAKRYHLRCIITGTKEEIDLAREIHSMARSKPIVAAGKTTLGEMAPLIERCSLFITGDSAPLHIAAAVGTHVIALFGPTSPKRHIPAHAKVTVIFKNFKCSPCYKPRCRYHRCMREIKVDEVLKAVADFIEVK